MYSDQQSLIESMICKSVCCFMHFFCFFQFHICVGHACAGLRLMLVIILHQSSILFTSQGLSIKPRACDTAFLARQLTLGALFTSSEAGIVGWLPCPPGISMGSRNPTSHPEPCPTKYFSYWAISQAPILALLIVLFDTEKRS